MLFVSLTLATFRKAEFGFFGVTVFTEVHTPLFCGDSMSVCCLLMVFSPLRSAGAVDFFTELVLPSRTNWLIVGIFLSFLKFIYFKRFRSKPKRIVS
jgi:hypothetical protein